MDDTKQRKAAVMQRSQECKGPPQNAQPSLTTPTIQPLTLVGIVVQCLLCIIRPPRRSTQNSSPRETIEQRLRRYGAHLQCRWICAEGGCSSRVACCVLLGCVGCHKRAHSCDRRPHRLGVTGARVGEGGGRGVASTAQRDHYYEENQSVKQQSRNQSCETQANKRRLIWCCRLFCRLPSCGRLCRLSRELRSRIASRASRTRDQR